MANFTSEATVRLRFQLNDTTMVPMTLVENAIDDAHTELLRWIDPQFDVPSPEDGLIMGETLLAGAQVYRALASGEAFGQKRMTIGGQRIEESGRFETMTELADLTEEQAWFILEPYVVDRPAQTVADASDTTPVLGEE
jgi:hypothetical protein